MVENELQYRITREEAEKFETALELLAARPGSDDPDDLFFRRIEEDGLRSQLGDLRAELAAYESHRSGRRGIAHVVQRLWRTVAGTRSATPPTHETR